MKAQTYIEHNHFALLDKPEPEIIDPRDAVVRVTLGSICTSDLTSSTVPYPVPCPVSPSATRWWVWWNPSVQRSKPCAPATG